MKPLFITAPARSGSTFLARILDTHPKISIASDPALPIFSHFRNRVWENASYHSLGGKPNRIPLLDYYFKNEYLDALSYIREADWGISMDFNGEVKSGTLSRLAYESADLRELVNQISATNFDDWINQFLLGLLKVRNKPLAQWAGMKELWTVEFVESLARSFPEARFICLMRDPRAIISSLLAMANRDPSQMAHVPSYLRHWRKFVAFHSEIRDSNLLGGRWLMLRYEDLISRTEEEAQKICEFLEVEYEPLMINPLHFKGYSEGVNPISNSSYEKMGNGIYSDSREKWKSVLTVGDRDACSLLAGKDATVLGYDLPIVDMEEHIVEKYLQLRGEVHCSWRSDLKDYKAEAKLEILRYNDCIKETSLSADELSRFFLFPSAYGAIQYG